MSRVLMFRHAVFGFILKIDKAGDLLESNQKKIIENQRKSQMILAVLRAALIFAIVGSSWAARPGDFRPVGPGGGGAMFNPTVSPHDENTVLISCDMTGAYITHDGGHSWRMFNLRGTVRFFAFDPIDQKTMYAGVTGLWRSRDGGETWTLLYPKPANIQGIRMDSDHADESIVAEPNPLGSIVALAIDPADSRTLYAAAAHDKKAGLYISRDFGESWRREAALPEIPRRLWVDSHSPRSSRTLYIGGPHYISVKSSTGIQNRPTPTSVTFTDISAGFGTSALTARSTLSRSRLRTDTAPRASATGRSTSNGRGTNGQPLLYGTAEQGAFVSSDGGTTWAKCALPGAGARVRAVAASLHNPETAYLSYNHLQMDGKTWMGVAKTADAGRTWKLMWKESDTPTPNVHDAWITARLGTGWGENPLMLGVADQNPNLCYGTDFGRTMQTTNGGATWAAVYSRKVPDGDWTSTGLDVTTSYGIHFDPFDTKRRFITYTDIGLFRSEDGGLSWTSATQGVPRNWLNTTYWIEFDPKVRGRVWSVNSYTHDLPRPKMWRHNSVLNYRGGVCRSDDGGRTWAKSNTGMEETAPTHILLDPASPSDARVLYVAAFGRGVYKSGDGGKTWRLKNKGITQKEPFAWRIIRANDGTLYVLIARRSDDGSIGNAGDGAIYKSTDGAENWTSVALPSGVNGPNGLAIDPTSPTRMYLAAWARAAGMHGEDGGIYLSEDGGRTWRHVLDRDQHVYDVTVDRRDPKIVYAAGFESAAWRSADSGEHWTRIPGFNFKWGHRVIPDPADKTKIYVTTFGGSVWHGSVDGKPRPLDIATPQLQPGH
jgi:photosystem II stability/assembly factor-like uncharacterized protein